MRVLLLLPILMMQITMPAWAQFAAGILATDQVQLMQGERLMAADVDGDGWTDLVMQTGVDVLWLHNADGAGSFAEAEVLFSSDTIYHFDLADLDGDLDLDLVVVHGMVAAMSILANQGAGLFGEAELIGATEETGILGSLLCHDIDMDGDIDVLVLADDFHFFRNDGASFTEVPMGLSPPGGPIRTVLLAGDVDLDGDQDLVMSNWNAYMLVALNMDGIGTEWDLGINTVGINLQGVQHKAIQLHDVDGDGDLDVVNTMDDIQLARNPTIPDGWGEFAIEDIAPGSGSFGIGWSGPMGCSTAVSALWQLMPWTGPVQWSTYDGTLDAFTPPIALMDSIRSVQLLAADLNNDGVNDIIIADRDHPRIWWYPNLIPVLSSALELTPFDTLCTWGDSYPLTHASPSGGTWVGAGVADNIFTPPGSGTYELTYQVVDPGSGCPLGAVQGITTISEPLITLLSGNPDECAIDPLQYVASPGGGQWSGIIGLDGAIDRSCASRPIFGEGSYIMNAPNGGDCMASTNTTLSFPACTTVDLGADILACEDDDEDVVVEFVMPSASYYVELLGPFYLIEQSFNHMAQGYFSPSMGPGSYMIIGNAVHPLRCPDADTLFIIVNPNPNPVMLTTDLTFCANQSEGQVETDMAGDFSAPINVASSSIGTFNPSLLVQGYHLFTFNVVDANGCEGSLIDSLLIVDPPTVTLDMSPININGGLVFLEGGNPEGGIYTVNGIVAATLNPSIFQVGDTIEVVYSYTDPLTGCTGTAIVQVDIVTLTDEPGIRALLRLAPNPARGHCQFWFGDGDIANIELLDALGRRFRSWPAQGSPAWLDLSGLSAGSYQVLVESASGAWSQRLLIE